MASIEYSLTQDKYSYISSKTSNTDQSLTDSDSEEYCSGSSDDSATSLSRLPQINEVNVLYIKYPDECCPKICAYCSVWPVFDRTIFGRMWFKWRMANYFIVEHKYFETFIIIMILASSGALVCTKNLSSQGCTVMKTL